MDHPAAPPPPSMSSAVAQRKRIIATRTDPPTPLRFGSMAKVMRRRKASSDTRGSGGLGGELRRKRKRPFSSMAKVTHRRRSRSRTVVVHAPPPPAYDDDVVCESCGSGDRDDELLLCDRCDRGHHTFCLRPIVAKIPIGPWFCPDCAPPAKCLGEDFPMDQTKIDDFFHIQKEEQDGEPTKCRLSQDVRRRVKHSLVMRKKRRMILPFVPTEDNDRRLKQMASLATALTSSKMEFSNELTYVSNMAPRSSNQARLEEGGIQVLHKEDKETIELCRTMQQKGKCPPLLVVFDSLEGFTIQADADIKQMTFIAEFVGDVDYLEKRANDDCGCLMTLLLTADPSQNLVICPDKRGNISRFISGINNHTPDGKKKQNVKCVRYDIDGESRVLLVACRDIACGAKLYCDYNGHEGDDF